MVAISKQQDTRLRLKAVFQSIHGESCPHDYNFHMHTVCSDGQLRPEALIQQAIAIGLQELAITDHHSIAGYHQASQWLQSWQQDHPDQPRPYLWTGIEISADLLDNEVHILAYAFEPDHPAIAPYLQGETVTGIAYQARQVIRSIHQAEGLAVLAHPARYKRSFSELIPAAAELGIDGVETYYAYGNPHPWRPSPDQTRKVREVGDAYGLLHTCGTDTHGLNLLQRI